MELSEYLTRIDLKGATNTRFKRDEREVKITRGKTESTEKLMGIQTYTYFENGSMGATGWISYDKNFPEPIFEMNPVRLKKIMEESDTIEIEQDENGLYDLVGISKYGEFRVGIHLLERFKAGKGTYDNEPIILNSNDIETLKNREAVIGSDKIRIFGTGDEITFTFLHEIGGIRGEMKLRSSVKCMAILKSREFLEVLGKIKDKDVKLYIDIQHPENRKKSPVKLEIADASSLISYFITEESRAPESEAKSSGE